MTIHMTPNMADERIDEMTIADAEPQNTAVELVDSSPANDRAI